MVKVSSTNLYVIYTGARTGQFSNSIKTIVDYSSLMDRKVESGVFRLNALLYVRPFELSDVMFFFTVDRWKKCLCMLGMNNGTTPALGLCLTCKMSPWDWDGKEDGRASASRFAI